MGLRRRVRYVVPERTRWHRQRVPSLIYFACPDHSLPIGGDKMIYRHVDVLNKLGSNAAVLHRSRGFRCTWFANGTRVVSEEDIQVLEDDILVVPEVYVANYLVQSSAPCRVVIFNQNGYLTFLQMDVQPPVEHILSAYCQDSVLGIITVSPDSRALLELVCPNAPVVEITYGIDTASFRPRSKSVPLAFMPRRGEGDLNLVVAGLLARGSILPTDVCRLDGMNEAAVAEAMGQAHVFIAASVWEGFGLPVLEALAAGAAVVGYDGGGAREVFQRGFARRVEPGDIHGFVDATDRALADVRQMANVVAARAAAAREYIETRHSLSIEAASIEAAWMTLLR